MRYMLVFFETSEALAKREQPAAAQAYWGAWMEYVDAIAASGIVVGGHGLQSPHTATLVSVKNGKRHIQDGPLADAKEHLGGYYIIDAKDLDVALDWAARSPNALDGGRTEVRPVLENQRPGGSAPRG